MVTVETQGEIMVKWPFKRSNSQNADLPTEVKDYYQAENREKRSLAWLLAFGTLVVTVLLALAVFFGGRWIYRKVANKPTTTNPTSHPAGQPTQTPQNGAAPSGSTTPTPTGQTSTPTASQPTPATTPRTGPDGDY